MKLFMVQSPCAMAMRQESHCLNIRRALQPFTVFDKTTSIENKLLKLNGIVS